MASDQRRVPSAPSLTGSLARLKHLLHRPPGAERAEGEPGSGLASCQPLPQNHPMARPLRIEFADAVYHVTSRGDRREAIYRDDEDRQRHLAVIAQAMDRFDAQVLAYCLMGNHYHLVVQTRQANLSRLMRHINGITTQQFNRRHGLGGCRA